MRNILKDTLDQTSQIKLKLLNPLGVATHLVVKIEVAAQTQHQVLEQDLNLLENVNNQQEIYQLDQEKAFSLRMAELENIFFEMEQRGDEFFEERFQAGAYR